MIRLLAPLLAMTLSLSAVTSSDELDVAYAEAIEELVDELHRFASWCSSSKLYLERDKAFESVLYFDPDDFKAHKGLKHSRERDGTWTIPADREASKNYKPSKLEKCSQRRAKLVAEFQDQIASVFAKYEKDVTREHRERLYEAVLQIDPDHAETRALRGEVLHEKLWVLTETRASRLARADWNEFLQAAAQKVPATERVTETEWESGLGIRWTTALRTPHLRILAMVDRSETSQVVTLDHLARSWVDTFARLERTAWPSYTIYVVPDRVSKEAFVKAHTELRDIPIGELDRGGYRIGEAGDVVRWDRMKLARLESLASHAAQRAIEVRFRAAKDQAWLFEGLASYLSQRLIETQATGFSDERAKEEGGAPEWIRRALANYASESPRTLARVLTLRAVEMQPEDRDVAFAFSAFLLEGYSDKLALFTTRLSKGEPVHEALAEVTGRTLDELESRLLRWLEERG